MNSTNPPIWQPSAERIAATRLTAFAEAAGRRWNRALAGADYSSLHAWSIAHPEEFWTSVWEFGEVRGEMGSVIAIDREKMPGAKWFPEAKLNFAENLLRRRDDGDALVFWGEDKRKRRMSHGQLYLEVARLAAALRSLGVVAGDRVAAYMPNLPETLVAMLAAASIGAIFTSASPDFGVQGVLDRFGQTEPKVLFAWDGYFYNGKTIDSMAKVAEIAAQMPSLQKRGGGSLRALHARPLGHCRMRHDADDFVAPFAPREHRVRRTAFRTSALHHVFLGHHRRTQVHRALRRRGLAAAHQGTPVAYGDVKPATACSTSPPAAG
jgi:acetoacetyl-CoA synthetase